MTIVHKRTFFLPAWAKMSGDVVLGKNLFNKSCFSVCYFAFVYV